MWLLQLLVLLVVYSYQPTAISWLNDAYSRNIVQMRQQSFSNNSRLLTKADDASIIDHVSDFFFHFNDGFNVSHIHANNYTW
jgi:hypothetical protein